jgi:hypothetical protein
VITPGIERFGYFRLLARLLQGQATPDELLAAQDRYDNYFLQPRMASRPHLTLTFPSGPSARRRAICYLTRVISTQRASRVRWWYQCDRAWWPRRQSSQCPALPGGGG